VSGTLAALLAGLAIAALVLFPVGALPKPSGERPVGVRTFEVVDAGRPGLLAAAAGEPRRLLVRVWYPAGDTQGLKPRPYFTIEEARTTGRSLGALFKFPPFFTYLKHVRTNSYENAPLAPGASGLPVVIYSHGFTSFLGQNTVLMEELASHGYVVFSLQHTYDSAATLFPDGTLAPMDPKMFDRGEEGAAPVQAQIDAIAGKNLDARLQGQLQLRETGLAKAERITRSGVIWAADRIFLHDQLQAGRVPDAIKPILAASDLTRVGEMGMSFGGATSGSVCMVDRRCAAGINLDGADFPFQAFDAAMPVPFLMFHSDMRTIYQAMGVEPPGGRARAFNDFSYETFATAGTNPKVQRLQLREAKHLGLSDFSLFIRRPVRDPLLGATPAKVMIGAQNDYVRAFFDRHLRGRYAAEPPSKTYADWILPADNSDVRSWWAAKSPAEQQAIEARIAQLR
jgi:predicted dienelactone hydrolase